MIAHCRLDCGCSEEPRSIGPRPPISSLLPPFRILRANTRPGLTFPDSARTLANDEGTPWNAIHAGRTQRRNPSRGTAPGRRGHAAHRLDGGAARGPPKPGLRPRHGPGRSRLRPPGLRRSREPDLLRRTEPAAGLLRDPDRLPALRPAGRRARKPAIAGARRLAGEAFARRRHGVAQPRAISAHSRPWRGGDACNGRTSRDAELRRLRAARRGHRAGRRRRPCADVQPHALAVRTPLEAGPSPVRAPQAG